MIKHTQTICRLLADELFELFDHFVELALNRLTHFVPIFPAITVLSCHGEIQKLDNIKIQWHTGTK